MREDLILPGHVKDKRKVDFRILACYDCYTLEKLPPYKGPVDGNGSYLEKDLPLETLIETKHTTDGQPHKGRLFVTDEKTWLNIEAQKQISKEIFKDKADVAELRETFSDDALKCYNTHNRPKDGCIDWMDESKRLPSTIKGVRNQMFLCHWCPVASGIVAPKLRKKLGLYD